MSIPPSVTELGRGAFESCRNLTEVQFAHEGALKVIGDEAFYNCKALQQVSIPPSVTKLGYGAFSGCSNLIERLSCMGLRACATRGMSCINTMAVEAVVTPRGPLQDLKRGDDCFHLAKRYFYYEMTMLLLLIAGVMAGKRGPVVESATPIPSVGRPRTDIESCRDILRGDISTDCAHLLLHWPGDKSVKDPAIIGAHAEEDTAPVVDSATQK
ncbi:hypothetical protein THAOC_35981 [Thalassiosira oceanica]|uniref:Uncharacterized protein n=1 Tax=Thalassiosira oceanica TaxID=159749 RepID=K0R0Y7_THAOC|nr:hypothetical protein THAOC_35981 [Thalassiosira oceanica]|eukprot:EJK45405.1 hypothetical protein THAOC_35981 [Thalassiosira oceanica]